MSSSPERTRGALCNQLLAAPGGKATSALEEHLGAPVRASKLEQVSRVLSRALSELEAPAGTPVIDRSVVLQALGQDNPLLWGATTILPRRLPTSFVQDLLDTDVPIGTLCDRHRLFVTSRYPTVWEEPAASWRALLPTLGADDVVMRRSYVLLFDHKPAISVSETFPAQ